MILRTPRRKGGSRSVKGLSAETAAKLFTDKNFQRYANDLQNGNLTLPKVTLTHENLQVIIRNTGTISYHALYWTQDGVRTSLTLGHHSEGMRLPQARQLTETIRKLADRGIDVQDGLHKRLIRELTEQGEKWKP
jgi:hypothetical protein